MAEFEPTTDGVYQSPSLQRLKLRKQGYTTCLLCDGMGNLANRFTRVIFVCPRCQGDEVVPPSPSLSKDGE